MFGRKLEIRAVKDTAPKAVPAGTTQVHIHHVDFKDIEGAVKKTVILVSAAVATQKVVKTACKVVEIYASK